MTNPPSVYNRYHELKSFDDTKAGVKGLVDDGLTTIPQIFIHPPEVEAPFSESDPTIKLEIPVIDLDGLSGSTQRSGIVEQVRYAAETGGFFQLLNHGVPVQVLEAMVEGVRRFYEQPNEEKAKYYNRDITKTVRYNSNYNLFLSPAANWRDSIYFTMVPNSPDPEDLPAACREILMEFSRYIEQLGDTLFELLSEALGLSSSHLKDMGCDEGLSIISHYYPPCPQPELTMGTTRHTDSDFFTVLLQDRIGGLQVHHQNQWIDVKPVDGALVVNIGDLLQLVSNDKFKSSEHRVVAKKEGPRISVASFFRPDMARSVKLFGPIEDLVTEENPPVYRATSVKDYVGYYYNKGLDGGSTLMHYKL